MSGVSDTLKWGSGCMRLVLDPNVDSIDGYFELNLGLEADLEEEVEDAHNSHTCTLI